MVTFRKSGGIAEVKLGFQPLGIAIKDGTFVVADYFGPALIIGEVTVDSDEVRLHNVKRIAGTLPRRDNARMFPDVLSAMAVNRMQAVVIYSPKHLGITRNMGHEVYDIKCRDDGNWEHHASGKPKFITVDSITSAVLTPGGLVTIEINHGTGKCFLRDYRNGGLKEREMPPHRYGIAVRKRDGAIFTIVDSRASDDWGLYIDDKRCDSYAVGNGIALINDGEDGALVTRYAYEEDYPFGQPGALVYLPAKHLR